jgi:hypothetical protein
MLAKAPPLRGPTARPHLAHTPSARLRPVYALALTLLVAAAAQTDHAASVRDYLARMDRDADGRVGLDEYQAFLSWGFESQDLNGDGMLDRAELGVRARSNRPITRDAHRRSLAATFERQDADGNGFLDVRELASPPR